MSEGNALSWKLWLEAGFGASFARTTGTGRWGKPRGYPSFLGRRIARRKLLKIERLRLFQIDANLPIFRQALHWRKWETVWVI
jgi:hypothetical protein